MPVTTFDVSELLEGLAVRKLAEHASHVSMDEKLSKCCIPFIKKIISEEYRNNARLYHLKMMEMTDSVIVQKMSKIGHFLLHSFRSGLLPTPKETLTKHLEIIDCIKH